ncbi:hypothetical protein J5N97_015901 [Dioscorea zingiberensis]|uniref:Uncharacterized protein n=1 Tax=Dioscorea zingiberensis TaxID=325984 RepID=A0A9D5HEP4_9LILI|nr:hypothetical protein J5N97_015901 [Dioscorea zingiberensis]
MAGGREIEDETRNQMMQNLFGDQSEDEEEDEEEEVDSEHDAAVQQPAYHSDEGEVEAEFEGDGEIEGQGEAEVESEPEVHDVDPEQGDSEGERVQSSPERAISEQKIESGGKDAESEEEGYGQRVVTSRRRDVIASESEGSDENQYADNDHEDEEVDQRRTQRSPNEQDDNEVVRDVFGDSDEEEPDEYAVHNELEQDSHRSPMEEEGGYEKDMRPEDVVPDEDAPYESEEENLEQKPKEKPVGPPLEIEVPLCRPPGPTGQAMANCYIMAYPFFLLLMQWYSAISRKASKKDEVYAIFFIIKVSSPLNCTLLDSRHKKVYKVKNCITDIDPEKEKEEKEKDDEPEDYYSSREGLLLRIALKKIWK